MLPEVVQSDLKRIYGSNWGREGDKYFTESDVLRWSGETGATSASLYSEIAIYLARGFQRSELTFDFCGIIMNYIFHLVTSSGQKIPDHVMEVYGAFDEGEYSH